MHGGTSERRSAETRGRIGRGTLRGTVSRYMRQNAVGFVALFVALGGGAYAAGHQIGTSDIEDGAVTRPATAR